MSASESLFSQLTDDSSHDDQMKAILEQLKKLDCLQELKATVLSNKEEIHSLGKAVSDLQDQQLKDMEEMKAEILTLKTQLNDQTKEVLNQKKGIGANTTKLAENAKKVDVCTLGVDERQQNSRNYCGRLNNIDVTSADGLPELEHEQEVIKVVHEVFEPVLKLRNSKLGLDLNNPNSYIETAHVLPMPKNGNYKCPPVYIRFKKRAVRNIILANKKEFIVRDCDKEKGVKSYSFSADLTKLRFDFMQALIASKTFTKVWHNDGKSVKFTLAHTAAKVYKIKMFELSAQALIAKYSNSFV
jgi:hypothetical protein